MVVTAAFWAVSAQSLPKRLLAPLVPGISQAIAEALREFGSSASVLNSVLAVCAPHRATRDGNAPR